jgi:hypothetical protein
MKERAMTTDVNIDVLTLWQAQDREERMLPLTEIRTKAERLDAMNRRWRWVVAVLVVLVVGWEAWQVWTQTEMLERAGDLLTIAAFVYIAFRFRTHCLTAPPAALGRTTGADFYRAAVARQRDLSKDSAGYLLPFVPGVALALVGGGFAERPIIQSVGLVALGVALFLAVAWWNSHTARRLQNEIDALDAS